MDESSTRRALQEELLQATARLKAHLATWEYAFAMGASCHGGTDHPVHRETRARTERLADRCCELQVRLTDHDV